jgi:hypothetical protein
MTTAKLYPRLEADVEVLAAANAAVWLVCGVPALLVPSVVLRVLGIAGSILALRSAGALLLVLALALALHARGPLGLRTTGALAGADGLMAVALPIAPFALRVQVGAPGWALLGTLFFVLGSGATAWFFVRERLTHQVGAAAPWGGAGPA